MFIENPAIMRKKTVREVSTEIFVTRNYYKVCQQQTLHWSK